MARKSPLRTNMSPIKPDVIKLCLGTTIALVGMAISDASKFM